MHTFIIKCTGHRIMDVIEFNERLQNILVFKIEDISVCQKHSTFMDIPEFYQRLGI